jgi:hypothetical protein
MESLTNNAGSLCNAADATIAPKPIAVERAFQHVSGVPFYRLGDGQVIAPPTDYSMYVVVKGSRAQTMRTCKGPRHSLLPQPGIQVDGIEMEASDPLSLQLYLHQSLRVGLGLFRSVALVDIKDEADRQLFRMTLRDDVKPVFEAMCLELGIQLTNNGGDGYVPTK